MHSTFSVNPDYLADVHAVSAPHDQDHQDHRHLTSIPGTPSSVASDGAPISSLSSSLFLSSDSNPDTTDPLQDDTAARTLIIPSMTIPPALTGSGEAPESLRLWVVGRASDGCSPRSIATSMLVDHDAVGEIDPWVDLEYSLGVLRARLLGISSTTSRSDGSEYLKDVPNVEIFAMTLSVDSSADVVSDTISRHVLRRFTSVKEAIDGRDPDLFPLQTASSLESTWLYTAVVVLVSEEPTAEEMNMITELSPILPVILLNVWNHDRSPEASQHHAKHIQHAHLDLESFRHLIFDDGAYIAELHTQASRLFLRWTQFDVTQQRRRESIDEQENLNSPSQQSSTPGNIRNMDVANSLDAPSSLASPDSPSLNAFHGDPPQSQITRPSPLRQRTALPRKAYTVPSAGPNDPLNARHLTRLAAAILPTYFTRQFPRLFGDICIGEKNIRQRAHPSTRWGVFGFGVGVGVLLSLCFVGVGLDFAKSRL